MYGNPDLAKALVLSIWQLILALRTALKLSCILSSFDSPPRLPTPPAPLCKCDISSGTKSRLFLCGSAPPALAGWQPPPAPYSGPLQGPFVRPAHNSPPHRHAAPCHQPTALGRKRAHSTRWPHRQERTAGWLPAANRAHSPHTRTAMTGRVRAGGHPQTSYGLSGR